MEATPSQQNEQPSPRQQLQLQKLQLNPQSPNHFIKSTQELLADAYTGRDVTRPRDLYTFLSLGHIPETSETRRQLLKSRSVNTDYRRVTFDLRDSVSRRKSFGFGETPSRFLQFDLRKSPLIPLPSIKNSTFPLESRDGSPVQKIVAEALADEIIGAVPISVIKGYHKVNLSTTYIFTPEERLEETLKYNTKVVLPKIPSNPGAPEEIVPPSVLTIDSHNNVESLHRKKFEVVNISPRQKVMQSGNHVFGMRPECMFINTQLGNKNPLLRENNKPNNTSNVPKALPGLQDLKDYECYPELYWKVRADTIAQPQDLEADMIDRDLYRLRQISTLKLSTIERTFPVKDDPFRKWRGKAGEPLFSPKQQKPPERKRSKKPKSTEISVPDNKNGLSVPKLPLEMRITPLRLPDPEAQANGKEPHAELLSSRTDATSTPSDVQDAQGKTPRAVNANGVECPDLPTFDTPKNGSEEATPREALEESLSTYRKLQEERDTEENYIFGTVTVQKLHQMKQKKEPRKQTMKTHLVKVDLDPVDLYNKQHGTGPKRQMNGAGTVNSSRVPIDSDRQPYTDRPRTSSPGGPAETTTISVLQTHINGSKPKSTAAPVAALLFKPPANFKVPGSYPDALSPSAYGYSSRSIQDELADAYINGGFVYPSSEVTVSEAGDAVKGGRNNSNTPMKPVQLEVFSERREIKGPIKIPTGRTSYHPDMPVYKLDLRNYPPSNARQMCRASSAGVPDSRQTQFTQVNADTIRELSANRVHRQATAASGPVGTGEGTSHPPRSADVDIRFGGSGEVILASRDKPRAGNGRVSR